MWHLSPCTTNLVQCFQRTWSLLWIHFHPSKWLELTKTKCKKQNPLGKKNSRASMLSYNETTEDSHEPLPATSWGIFLLLLNILLCVILKWASGKYLVKLVCWSRKLLLMRKITLEHRQCKISVSEKQFIDPTRGSPNMNSNVSVVKLKNP